MYVKVTSGIRADGRHTGDFLAEVTPPLSYDSVPVAIPGDATWKPEEEGGRLLDPKLDLRDWEKAIDKKIDRLTVLEINPEPQSTLNETRDLMIVRYVWWVDPVHACTAVVTTRNIFVLGANGKTIDRV